MQTLELDEKTIVGLLLGSLEERLELLNNEKVLKTLDIKAFDKLLDTSGEFRETRFLDEQDMLNSIRVLQVLAYNRHKTMDSEKTAEFVFDKLFELITYHFH